MNAKKKVWKVVVLVIVVILLAEWLFIGYRYNFGPFKKLGDFRMSNLEGNSSIYDVKNVENLDENPLAGKNVCFLGSSVTYGSASLREGIPEYFEQRLGCIITKEAVSGTTLTDDGKNSYVQRLLNNVDKEKHYDLLVCQLSTNDASKDMPLGEITDGTNLDAFDTQTITGAIEYIICYSQKTLGCPVVFYTNSLYVNDNYDMMVKRLSELQSKWDIGVLNLWDNESFNDISSSDRVLYMYDEIHPTKAGYFKWWCPELEHQLLEYVE